VSGDEEVYRNQLRKLFGETLSDDFVNTMLLKLLEALRPSPLGALEEATVNAALAIIGSVKPRDELEALMAVQIVATGFASLRFLHQSQRHLSAEFVQAYAPPAQKLLRLQLDLIQALDRRRGAATQNVEVRHVHVHAGGQAAVGILNGDGRARGED